MLVKRNEKGFFVLHRHYNRCDVIRVIVLFDSQYVRGIIIKTIRRTYEGQRDSIL